MYFNLKLINVYKIITSKSLLQTNLRFELNYQFQNVANLLLQNKLTVGNDRKLK